MSKLIEWAKNKTPQARRERMINEAIDEERNKAYNKDQEFCFRVNTSILDTLFKQCPKDHLIVIGRTVGTGRPDTFEDSVKELVASIQPEERLRVEYGSCRVVINPANCLNVHSTVSFYYGHFGGHHDIITRWKYVPYPNRWKKAAE